MSLKSFLAGIIAGIASLFKNLSAELKGAVDMGVVITENLKIFADSSYADILTAIIPGTIDDTIKVWLRAQLPKILTDLKLVDAALGLTDPNQIMAAAMKTLQAMDPKISKGFYHNISILVAQVAADGKLTWSDAVYILQYYYENEFQAAA